MGTGISWSDETWNPVVGCSKVSPGCAHCYAETLHEGRFDGQSGYPSFKPWTPENAGHNVRLRPDRLDQPLRWTRPRMVFVNSMSDLFHERLTGLPSDQAKTQEEVDRSRQRYTKHEDEPLRPDYIAQVFAVMSMAERHVFQVLTKRPKAMALLLGHPNFWLQVNAERMRRGAPVLPGDLSDYAAGRLTLPNLWLGTSIENNRFVGRAEWLKTAPARVRFISAEPLLGPLPDLELAEVDGSPQPLPGAGIDEVLRVSRLPRKIIPGIDWVIVGGESGPGYRPMDLDWARQLREACRATDTAFFFKQVGGRTPKAGGTELDGQTYEEMPQALEGSTA